MSNINTIIPSQGFELIRDRIADILLDEVHNQSALSDDLSIDVPVYLERVIPLDKSEIPAYNVSLASGTFANKDYYGSVDGTYQILIDAYSNSKSTDAEKGITASSKKMHRMIGIARAIFENPVHKTLLFPAPFISRIFCSGFDVAIGDKDDALNTAMGRLTLTVIANETTALKVADLIKGYTTRIKLSDTDQGYVTSGVGVIGRVAEDGRLRITQSGLRRIIE